MADANRLTAKLAWDWSQGAGDPADSFEILVGTSSGNYNLPSTSGIAAALRQYPVSGVVSAPGTYFFNIRAANTGGSSANDGESSATIWEGLVAEREITSTPIRRKSYSYLLPATDASAATWIATLRRDNLFHPLFMA